MAEKVIRVLTDDLEAAEGREVEATITRRIGLDGVWHRIDLSVKNAARLDAAMATWWENSRLDSNKKTVKAPTVKPTGSGYNSEQLKAVREWARKNGWARLSDRGRVPADAIAAFEAAGGVGINPEFSAQ